MKRQQQAETWSNSCTLSKILQVLSKIVQVIKDMNENMALYPKIWSLNHSIFHSAWMLESLQ